MSIPHNSKGHVLVVDDSEFVCALVAEVLGDAGWTVDEAYAGEVACEWVRTHRPDAVICDLHMPDMTGFEVIETVHNTDPGIPVIILSGDDNLGAVLGAVRKGAFDYVLKSKEQFGPLVAAVERACTHARLTRENHALREELLEQRDQAMAANRAKSDFLANMSHELRTPLNAVMGYAELLGEQLDDMGEIEMRGDTEHIRRSGKHLLGLIDDILDLAKVESGRATLLLEAVNLPEFLEEVGAIAHQLAVTNGNQLSVDIDPALAIAVVDAQKLRQCLLNLLGNASKFTSAGQIQFSVRREEVRGQAWARFQITDSGIGMSADQCARVFEAFVQGSRETSIQYGGTGLGLAITRHLVELMGGRISVRSELRAGSTFIVNVPISGLLVNTPLPAPARSSEPKRSCPGASRSQRTAEPGAMIAPSLQKNTTL